MENTIIHRRGVKVDSRIEICINENKSFVLQGGAGSGKTETLKKTLRYISKEYPNKKIACITHTNLAVDEIKDRVGEVEYPISTIHSFLHSFIKNYKKNIHQVIFELFKLDSIDRLNIESYADEKEQKKKEYEKYKKIYKKYSLFLSKVKKENITKVLVKQEYDKNPINLNEELNKKIETLHLFVKNEIKNKDFNKIEYNNSKFDDYKKLTYGHDGLLKITALLFEKYPLLTKILNDKYDFIFIDEYQDTNKKIIDFFIKSEKTKIGLFGDSMQSIYVEGVGDVNKYIEESKLKKIIKEDNYRSSQEVIEFINRFRNDGLVQKVALKNDEKLADRRGEVVFFYSIYEDKVKTPKEKAKYIEFLNEVILKIDADSKFKKLMLTNKSIAKELGFENLYEVFSSRYTDPKEYLDKVLTKLQFKELYELYRAYSNGEYNFVLSQLKKNGLSIEYASDKQKVKENIENITDVKLSAIEVLEKSVKDKLIKKNEDFSSYMQYKKDFQSSLIKDKEYQNFKSAYIDNPTYSKMKKIIKEIEEGEFKELEKKIKKENFYKDLFSEKINFNEIIKYFEYINEKTEYITMHKTKGSSIDNVLVVLDEYFWKEYSFKTLFKKEESEEKLKNQKLFYVACSRAKKNLYCLRIVKDENEKKELLEFFPDSKKI